jgi:hypothetical protein
MHFTKDEIIVVRVVTTTRSLPRRISRQVLREKIEVAATPDGQEAHVSLEYDSFKKYHRVPTNAIGETKLRLLRCLEEHIEQYGVEVVD